jgi:phosphoglycolate phosphatase-like HAD superfamily hydrolase
MSTTNDVLDRHLKCFGENDLDGVLADYSSDAVPFFQAFFSEFAKPGATFAMREQCVEGDYAYILWSAEPQTIRTKPRPTRLLCRTGRSSRNPLLPRSVRSAEQSSSRRISTAQRTRALQSKKASRAETA